MAFVIATTNMKGGVGKTTLTVNLAASLARNQNKRVLIVDLDTQISATLSLMPPGEFAKLRSDKRSLRYLIHRAIISDPDLFNQTRETIRGYVCNVPSLSLLPGDIDLYDEFLVSEMLHKRAVKQEAVDFEGVWNNFEKNLVRSILKTVENEYDIIILDCAPGYNLITRSALLASDFYLIPAKPEPLSLIGIQLLERRINRLREAHKQDGAAVKMEMLGIIFSLSGNLLTGNLLNGRYYNQVMSRLNEDFSDAKLFQTRIPMDVNVSKAVDTFTPVVLSNPSCSGGKAFQQLSQEFMQKLNSLARVNELPAKFALSNLAD